MYLKNLTVFGFKSFADKTALNFQPGVTAIVGPNGCGKSNVSDAIRWVLGEQSAKALRGGEMADVIFNGTDGRKPMGMGEVSLTLGGVDGENLRAAGVEVAYDEVTLTRRIFRDGGSEYFLNKTPCRLKDIQQLFMGTGVGRTSYSILAQGHITQILSSKPEDRRMIFEEAAGITKFKSQKKESLRKLEYTEQNLLRVADTIKEVKRQIGSLQRQAGKAKRYKQISLELQHLETQLARHQFDVLLAEISEKNSAVENLRNEIEQGSNDVLRFENEISQLRGRLSDLEHEVAAQQQRGLELKGEIDRHESRIQFNEERLNEIASQNSKALAEISQSEERLRAAEEELANVKQHLSKSESALAQHRLTLETKQSALKKVEEDLQERQESLREAQSAAFSAAQDLTRIRNEITALDLQKQGNTIRLEKLSAEKVQLEEERTRLESRLHEFTASVEVEKLNVATTRGSVEQRQNRLRELLVELQQSSTEQDQFLQAQAEKRSRLSVLEQLEGSREGFSVGTQAALRQSLQQLVVAEVLQQHGLPPGATYTFKHALVQDAAYGTLLREPRRALHARIAQALESQFAETAESLPEVLARHCAEAGNVEKAAVLWGKAGQRSAQRSALVEAAEQLKRALNLIKSLPGTPALRREEIKLQVELITPLLHVRGYAAPETRAAEERALLLIEQAQALGEPPEDPLLLFSALYGSWAANIVAFNGDVMRELAVEFLALAEKQSATGPPMIGHRLMGLSLLHTGEIAGGRAHLDRAIALYDPGEHRHLAMRFGQDVGASALAWRSLALLLVGYPQDALADGVRALKIARESRHSGTLIYVLNFSVFQHVYCGHFAAANALIDEFDILKDQIGSVFWGGWGTVQRGCVLALTGKVSEAVQNIASGIAEMRSTGTTLWMPLFLSHLAKAKAEIGQFDDASTIIDEATAAVKTTKESWYEGEINRVAGEIALLGTEPDAAKAEACFATALEIARKQKAKSWELRAAMSMARLLCAQGRRGPARDILAPVYGWFTQGFDTLDLRQAKILLDELAQ